jgi:hypothetical protein
MTLKVEQLYKFEFKLETALGYVSGDYVGSIHEESRRSRILRHCPFNLLPNMDHLELGERCLYIQIFRMVILLQTMASTQSFSWWS